MSKTYDEFLELTSKTINKIVDFDDIVDKLVIIADIIKSNISHPKFIDSTLINFSENLSLDDDKKCSQIYEILKGFSNMVIWYENEVTRKCIDVFKKTIEDRMILRDELITIWKGKK